MRKADFEIRKNTTNVPQRIATAIALFAICFCIISVRLIIVSTNKEHASNQSRQLAEESFYRSEIVDRNGVLLAVNLSTASLFANPQLIHDPEDITKKLVKIFPQLDKNDLLSKLKRNNTFTWVKRHITPLEQQKINELGEHGLFFKDDQKRIYPHKNLLSHIIGFVDVDSKGSTGVEKSFEHYLSNPSNKNAPLALSIDIRIQEILRNSLLTTMEKFSAIGGCGIIMDVTNGEIIALASLPDFDSNLPNAVNPANKFNRNTLGVYEMGSTFKIFNTALALDSGEIKITDSYDAATPIKVGRFEINDYHPENRSLNVTEIFLHSSNIGSAKMALQIGGEKQQTFLQKLGLFSPLDIEISEKSKPIVPAKWGKVTTMTVSYGHGIAVTPLHLVRGTAALLNGGKLFPDTLILGHNNGNHAYKTIMQKQTSDALRRLFRLNVEYGTGKNANVEHYLVGGKTGTAEKNTNGSYHQKALLSSFISAFPMNDPKYVILVMLDEPKGNKSTGGYATGGAVAAPVAKEVIAKMSSVLGIEPIDEDNYKIRREFWYENEKNKEMASVQNTKEN